MLRRQVHGVRQMLGRQPVVVGCATIEVAPVVGEEEDHIRKILPGFREYESRVRRFVPALTPRYESRIRFDPKLYLMNREPSALLGFLAFILLLCFKLALR